MERIRLAEKTPHRIDHLGAVGVHPQVFGFPPMASDVDVRSAFPWQAAQELQRVVAEVDAVDVDVVHVQQQQAVGFVEHSVDELQFAHPGAGGGVARDVLDADAPFENVLHALDAFRDVAHRVVGEGDGHEIVEVAVVAAGREMLGIEGDPVGVEKPLHVLEEAHVERRRPAQRERETVADEREPLGELPEALAQAPADVDPVLRRHLHEVDAPQRILASIGELAHEGAAQPQSGTANGRWRTGFQDGSSGFRSRSRPDPGDLLARTRPHSGGRKKSLQGRCEQRP